MASGFDKTAATVVSVLTANLYGRNSSSPSRFFCGLFFFLRVSCSSRNMLSSQLEKHSGHNRINFVLTLSPELTVCLFSWQRSPQRQREQTELHFLHRFSSLIVRRVVNLTRIWLMIITAVTVMKRRVTAGCFHSTDIRLSSEGDDVLV